MHIVTKHDLDAIIEVDWAPYPNTPKQHFTVIVQGISIDGTINEPKIEYSVKNTKGTHYFRIKESDC